jgi:hypothetical protein
MESSTNAGTVAKFKKFISENSRLVWLASVAMFIIAISGVGIYFIVRSKRPTLPPAIVPSEPENIKVGIVN